MELERGREIFEKLSHIKFHGNLSRERRVVPCGQTDTNGEANGWFSQFCESACRSALKIQHVGWNHLAQHVIPRAR
jgi:hypothetical protein